MNFITKKILPVSKEILRVSKEIRKIAPVFILLLILILPVITFGQGSIVPDCSPNCGYKDLFRLANNIINWIIMISVPVAAGVFAWAGFQMMINADNPGKRKDSIDMMKKVFIGFVIILSAWIIVTTITNALLSSDFKKAVPVEGVK